jgi:adenosine deaminase
LEDHPLIKMVTAGLNVTLGTDDPSISQITLTDEYHRACEELGLSKTSLKERILAAARVSFLPDSERESLVQALRKELEM